jgi:hypothetical protein
MALLNYSTEVPATRTVSQIIDILVKANAQRVLAEYTDQRPSGVAFQLHTAYGDRYYSLPVNVLAVEKVIRRYGSGVPPRFKTYAQAERIAWRILKDWLEAQVALIQTEMVALDQVLLPYMRVDEIGTTVYDQYRDQQLALGTGE